MNPETINLTYTTEGPISASGPASVVVADGATVPVAVALQLDTCLQPSTTMTVTVDAVGATSGLTAASTLVRTVVEGVTYWTQIATEPNTGRMDHVVGGYNGYVWDVTGYGADTTVRRYDPATDTWTALTPGGTVPPVNYARSGCTAGNTI